MGIRRTLANNGTSKSKNGPVEVRRVAPTRTWTVEQARDVWRQGYEPDQVERLTSVPRRAFVHTRREVE